MTRAGAELMSQLRSALRQELPAAAELRRHLHAAPRLSGDEAATATTVTAALGAGPGLPAAGTGRLVVMGEGPGSVALRGELDALPVVEQTGVTWASPHGAMHACGHDVHLAAVVAACRAIVRAGPSVPAAALLQPREETGPSGASDVVASGLLREHGVAAVVGAHVQPQLAPGTLAVTPGLVNASVDEFEITVTGTGGHAGYPHTVRDPVTALCNAVVSLQQLAAARIDPVHGAVCTVGRIDAGTAANVVPATAWALGSLRLMRPEDRTRAAVELVEIVQASVAAYGCRADVRILEGEPALRNDPHLACDAADLLRGSGYSVTDDFRSFGADDFAHYCQVVPSLMVFVGVDGGAGLHDGRFLPPETSIAVVADALLAGYVAAACNGRPAGP